MGVIVSPEVREIVKRYREVWALEYARSLLGWDMETYMPPRAFRERGDVNALLETLKQRLMTSPGFMRLVNQAEPENDVEKGIIRVLKRDLKYYTRLPKEFLMEEEKVKAEAFQTWRKAREKSDFQMYAPILGRIVDLQRRKAELLGYEDHPYDALLDLYEENLTVKKCDEIFSKVDLISDMFKKACRKNLDRHPLEDEKYEKAFMERLIQHVVGRLGYDFSRGRIDVSPHPFTMNMGLDDVRITVRYEGRDFRRALMAAIHEFGHATYEMNISRELQATPVQRGVSLGIHESQSRFWENIVGRSRWFVERFYGEMCMALPFLSAYDVEDVYRYFTLVRPELIRVEADELQYVLHVYLRYKVEKDLIEEKLEVGELPNVWNDLMESLVGVKPPNDRLGVLQDVHWSHAAIGYFPTYAIGSMVAAQIYKLTDDVAGMVEKTDFKGLMEVLSSKIHRWGAVYPPEDLLRKATGEEIEPGYFVSYLSEKYMK